MKEMILNNDVWETSPVTDHLKFQVPIYTKGGKGRFFHSFLAYVS